MELCKWVRKNYKCMCMKDKAAVNELDLLTQYARYRMFVSARYCGVIVLLRISSICPACSA